MQLHPSSFRWVVAVFASAIVLPVSAQGVRGSAEIRNPTGGVPVTVPGRIGAGATATTSAAVRVSRPASAAYVVNGAAGNAFERGRFDSLFQSSRPLIEDDVRNRGAYISGGKIPFGPLAGTPVEGLRTLIPKNTAEDVANNGFRLVAKPPATSASQVQNLGQGAVNQEFASASASQQVAPFRAAETALTEVARPGVRAFAIAVNRDPMAIFWDTSQHAVTIDFTGISFLVQTTPGAKAFTLLTLSASIRDGTDDVSLPEDGALPVYEFVLPVFSFDGAPAFFDAGNASFGAFGGVSDSAGHNTAGEVQAELFSRLVLLGPNQIGFASPYTVTVMPQGSSAQSVLYTRDYGLAGVFAVPEPGTTLLMLAGIACLVVIRRAQSRHSASTAASRSLSGSAAGPRP